MEHKENGKCNTVRLKQKMLQPWYRSRTYLPLADAENQSPFVYVFVSLEVCFFAMFESFPPNRKLIKLNIEM